MSGCVFPQVPSVRGQVQRAVAMAVLSLLCEVARGKVFNASLSLGSLREHFYRPEHLNQALLKPVATARFVGHGSLLFLHCVVQFTEYRTIVLT